MTTNTAKSELNHVQPKDDARCIGASTAAKSDVASAGERRTRLVVVVTLAMMIGELVVGTMTNSLALTADGWHMGSHAGALGLSAFAYWYARTRAGAGAFSFGTGKVLALAGYTNALILGLIAVWMIGEGCARLLHPVTVQFGEALPVAVLGLLVNIASAMILVPGHGDDAHGHSHAHDDHDDHDDHHDHAHDERGHHDVNMRSAYLHVIADALTSVFAIAALMAGRYLNWTRFDPIMALVGGAVILQWSVGLCRQSSRRLLDVSASEAMLAKVRAGVEALGEARVIDLHVWPIGAAEQGCIVSIESRRMRPLVEYRTAIHGAAKVAHLTVEVDHVLEESLASF